MMTNWRNLILDAMQSQGESLTDIVSSTLSDQDMTIEFSCRYGEAEGQPFTIWTSKRVYFPVTYDGSEWVESVSRNPDGKATPHVGGS